MRLLFSLLFIVSCSSKEIPDTIQKLSNSTVVRQTSLIQYAPDFQSVKINSPHLMLGKLSDAGVNPNDYLIVRKQYVLSYNNSRHVQNWTEWKTTPQDYGTVKRHKGNFLEDIELPVDWYRVTHKDYTKSGYDRGHQCPSEERTDTEENNVSTFILTNVIPQTHDLNAGPWEKLELYCRYLCIEEDDDIYVATGGIYLDNPVVVDPGIQVCEKNFKVVLVLKHGQELKDITEQMRVIAVSMPNIKGIIHDTWMKYVVSVGELEKQTKYRFFSAVSMGIASKLKEKLDVLPDKPMD